MKIGVAGAGAVGCHYGSMLHQAGFQVVLFARGDHLKALQNHGLQHESMGKLTTVRMVASDNAEILKDCDVIIIATKNTTLSPILVQIAPYLATGALLVTLQNGVRAPELVADALPDHPLAAGSAFIGARIEKPGYVIHSAAGYIRLAGWNPSANGRLQQLVDALNQSGVDAAIEQDAHAMLWTKMLWNCGFNAITALTRCYARDIAANPDIARWVEAAMQESVAVAQAQGVNLAADAVEKYLQVSRNMGEVKTSMWQDLESSRLTEIADMNGHIVELARLHSMSAPVNDMLASMIRAAERKLGS